MSMESFNGLGCNATNSLKFKVMNYTNQIIIAFEEIMKYEFPEIKNLKVTRGDDSNFVISFDEGIYTKEEVFSKLDEIRSYGKGLSCPKFNDIKLPIKKE